MQEHYSLALYSSSLISTGTVKITYVYSLHKRQNRHKDKVTQVEREGKNKINDDEESIKQKRASGGDGNANLCLPFRESERIREVRKDIQVLGLRGEYSHRQV